MKSEDSFSTVNLSKLG
jgi:hypothetical protein